MNITEETSLFQTVCLDCLSLVIEKYGLHLVNTDRDTSKPEADINSIKVLLCNKTTGLSFQTISYGTNLGVTLYRLIDGELPVTKGNAYGLDWIILLRKPSLRVRSGLNVPKSLLKQSSDAINIEEDKLIRDFKFQKYTQIFQKYAVAIDKCAYDVMEGDFSIFSELSNMSFTQWDNLYKKEKH